MNAPGAARSSRGGLEAEDATVRSVGEQVEQPIRTLADVADAVIEVADVPFLAGNAIAIEGDPHEEPGFE
jgi:hypothetical protein